MNQKILTIYNKKTKEIIGYHHPTKFVVDDINHAYIYDREIIDSKVFKDIFIKSNYLVDGEIIKEIIKVQKKYFKNIEYDDVILKYIDFNMIKRVQNIKKIRLKLLRDKAVNWWNSLPIQSLVDYDSWVHYVWKHFPNREGIYGLTDEEILFIWNKEKNNQNG